VLGANRTTATPLSRACLAAVRVITCFGPATAPAFAARAFSRGLRHLSLVSYRAIIAVRTGFSVALKGG
jgi:hypothetical protein